MFWRFICAHQALLESPLGCAHDLLDEGVMVVSAELEVT